MYSLEVDFGFGESDITLMSCPGKCDFVELRLGGLWTDTVACVM